MKLHQVEGSSTTDVRASVENGKSKEKSSDEMDTCPSEHASLVGLNDVADEFFDVPEPSDSDDLENGWTSDFGAEISSQVTALLN